MISWMVYAALIGMLIAAGALALERLVSAAGRPRRFVWLVAMGLAVVVPLAGGLGKSPEPRVVPGVVATESSAPSKVGIASSQGFVPPLPLPAGRTAARTAALIWGAGTVAVLAALCAVLFGVARTRRRWARGRIDGGEVYLSRDFGPALVGIAAPRVVIPRWVLELDAASRAAILRHEREHARARDHLALLCGGLAAVAFPWSPAIWWMCRRLRAAVEMDCDQRVIAGGIGAADYGAVLLQAGSRSQGRWGLAPTMGQPRSLLERRLKTMSEKRKKVKAAHGALLGAATLAALGVACDVTAPTSLEEAIEEVVADAAESRDTGDDAHAAERWYERISRAFRSKAPTGTPPPIMFVDDRRVSNAAETGGPGAPSTPLPPGHIKSVQFLVDSAAEEIVGEEAPGGVLRVRTSEADGMTLEEAVAQVKYASGLSGLLGVLNWEVVAGNGSPPRWRPRWMGPAGEMIYRAGPPSHPVRDQDGE